MNDFFFSLVLKELYMQGKLNKVKQICCVVIIVCILPWWLNDKEFTSQYRRFEFNPWVGKIPWRRKGQPIQVLLPGESHGWRSLVSYSPWGFKESDTTE